MNNIFQVIRAKLREIMKTADLDTMTSKVIRTQLEKQVSSNKLSLFRYQHFKWQTFIYHVCLRWKTFHLRVKSNDQIEKLLKN